MSQDQAASVQPLRQAQPGLHRIGHDPPR
ncbi:hypothetical protein [Rhodopirellula europaea]